MVANEAKAPARDYFSSFWGLSVEAAPGLAGTAGLPPGVSNFFVGAGAGIGFLPKGMVAPGAGKEEAPGPVAGGPDLPSGMVAPGAGSADGERLGAGGEIGTVGAAEAIGGATGTTCSGKGMAMGAGT